MDHMAAMEEQVVSERVKQKLQDVNAAAQKHLAPIQDHVNFTLQVWGIGDCICEKTVDFSFGVFILRLNLDKGSFVSDGYESIQ